MIASTSEPVAPMLIEQSSTVATHSGQPLDLSIRSGFDDPQRLSQADCNPAIVMCGRIGPSRRTGLEQGGRFSDKQLCYDLSIHIRQPEITTLVKIGEALVVESQAVQ